MRFFTKKVEPQYIYVVYGARSSSAPEPVIAVVSEENDALLIEFEVNQKAPTAIVQWETLPVEAKDWDLDSVSVLFALAGDPPDADPIGIKAFARVDDAEAALAQVVDGLPHEVRTYPIGWRTSGWPFDENGLHP